MIILYTSNGYPIIAYIEVTGGITNPNITDWYDTIQRYAVGRLVLSKKIWEVTLIVDNDAVGISTYKSSTTSSTTMTTNSTTISNYIDSNASVGYHCARFSENNVLSVYVSSGTNQGLMADLNYTYCILYSS